ncbi:diguanylate cyclase [uncultured Sphingomonas sp.]|uniref:diguanylate cyclase n=1 Tax=uncultured Sphingomonas sp. TaxID=158754 RepID=UPI00262F774E|nr:diguanylate cyclase [uncultured Sphingomonas sp.]
MRTLQAFVPRAAWPLIVGVAYFATAMLSIDLDRSANGIATMWPPSGILLAALLIAPWRSAPGLIGASALACFAFNLSTGETLATAAGFTLAAMTETTLTAFLLRRGGRAMPSFVTPRGVGRFCAAVGIGALAGAGVGVVATGFTGIHVFASWFVADVLGMAIVTPMIVTGLARDEEGRAVRTGTPAQAVILLGAVALVSCGVFAESSYPLLFLPMMALLVATYRLGPFGAASGVLIIAVIAALFSGVGAGPLVLIRGHDDEVTGFLQFYMAMLFATALPVAAILAARTKLTVACAESERMHRLLADSSRDIVVRLRLDGTPLYVSPACRRLLGYEPEEMCGLSLRDTIHPDDRPAVGRVWKSMLDGMIDPSCVYRERHRDGHYVWLEATCSLVTDPTTGAPIEVVAGVRDVSLRRAAEIAAAAASARLEESHRLLSMAERIALVGHWRLDFTKGTVFWSSEVYRMHAVDPATRLGLAEALTFYHPDDRARVSEIVNHSAATGESFEFTARIVRTDGELRHVVSRGEPEIGGDGALIATFGVIQDVSRQVEIESELEAARIAAENVARAATLIADTDALTGVASRRKTLQTLSDALAQARASGRPLSIATFDLDHFKTINDRYGHAVGDQVLQQVAAAAQASVRTGDLVGRIGGEEFLVILPGSDAVLAMRIAERLRAEIERVAATLAPSPPATVSVGVAEMCGAAADDLAVLLHKADCALYAAKQAGRNTLQLAA